jgi:hypothetical protein
VSPGNDTAKPDPFDLSRLRISQDFLSAAGVKKLWTTIPVRKPSKEWFVRTHPNEEFRLSTYVIELKEDSEMYLVEPSLWPELAGETTFGPRALITSINKQGVLFLWPIRLPGADGRIDDWNRSALEAATLAAKSWVRVQANMSLGGYEVYQATGSWGDAAWPELSFSELVRLAFKDKVIEALDHPVLKRLRGEA